MRRACAPKRGICNDSYPSRGVCWRAKSLASSRHDFEPVRVSPKPKFFVQGERDELCPLKDMQAFYARAADPKELVVIDAADHLFDGKLGEVAEAIEDLLGDWSA